MTQIALYNDQWRNVIHRKIKVKINLGVSSTIQEEINWF